MLSTTFLARESDGLILCQTMDEDANLNSSNIDLSKLNDIAHEILKSINKSSKLCSIDMNNFKYHYKIENGVIFMQLAEERYPQKLAFSFLESISACFREELEKTFGTQSVDYRSRIDTIDRPYFFIKFSQTIQKKKREYRDVRSSSNIERLNNELLDVSKIMSENFELLLDREKNIGRMGEMASTLRFDSQNFHNKSKKLKWTFIMRQYMTYIIIGAFAFLFLFLKFYVF